MSEKLSKKELIHEFSNLSIDTLKEIAYILDYKDLINLCLTNKRNNNKLCQNDLFWRVKYEKEFGEYSRAGPSPEKLYYILQSLLKEIQKVSKIALKYIKQFVPYNQISMETKIDTLISFLNYFIYLETLIKTPFAVIVSNLKDLDHLKYESTLISNQLINYKYNEEKIPDLLIASPFLNCKDDLSVYKRYYKIFRSLSNSFIKNMILFYLKNSENKVKLLENIKNKDFRYISTIFEISL